MSLHILIGHEKPGQRGTAQALYVGPSGADLQAAKARATCGSFTIYSNPVGLRKSNAAYNPASPFPAATVKLEIPADLKGLNKAELAAAALAAIARIKELEDITATLRADLEAAKATAPAAPVVDEIQTLTPDQPDAPAAS